MNKKIPRAIAEADKAVAEANAKTVTAADVKKMAEGLQKADAAVITKIKDFDSRDKNTDHFGGQFNLIIWRQ